MRDSEETQTSSDSRLLTVFRGAFTFNNIYDSLHFTDPPTDHAYMSISPTKPGMCRQSVVCAEKSMTNDIY